MVYDISGILELNIVAIIITCNINDLFLNRFVLDKIIAYNTSPKIINILYNNWRKIKMKILFFIIKMIFIELIMKRIIINIYGRKITEI
jgi:hypothetical protein